MHAHRPAARAFDPGGLLLIEAVQIGVVFGFSRLHQTVVDGLVVGEPVGLLEKPLPRFGQGENAQRLLLRDFKGLFGQRETAL